MKRFLALTLSMCVALSVVSCSQETTKRKKKDKSRDDDKKKNEIEIEVETQAAFEGGETNPEDGDQVAPQESGEDSKASDVDETGESTSSTIATPTAAPTPTPALEPQDYSYVDAYKTVINDHLEKLRQNGYDLELETTKYELINVDDDSIPELAIVYPGYAVSLYSYHGGTVHTLMDEWTYGVGGNAGYAYLPKKNVLYNGNADFAGAYYADYYMHMDDNHELYFEETDRHNQAFAEGSEPWSDDCEYLDERIYFIDGVQVSAEEYAARGYQGTFRYIGGNLTYDEVMAHLDSHTTPKVSLYTVVMGDYTWSEAERKAVEMGGHLATANDIDETIYISRVIRESDCPNGIFYVGGSLDTATNQFVWSSDGTMDPVDINTYDWRDGEPSFTGSTEDGRTVQENRMVIAAFTNEYGYAYKYMDVPDDTLDAAPTYSGKLGFILETEE